MSRVNKAENTAYARRWRAKNRVRVREYWKKRYYGDLETERRKSRHRQGKCKTARMQLIRDLKSKPCADCGIEYPFYVMDFDHVRGEKKYAIGEHSIPWEAIAEEIEKCDVVCANCHRKRTWQRTITANT